MKGFWTVLLVLAITVSASADIIVKTKRDLPDAAILGMAHGKGRGLERPFGKHPVFGRVSLVKTDCTDEQEAGLIAELSADPDIEYAEPDYEYALCRTPNDPMYPDLYGLQKLACEQAWGITTGSDVLVAVIDTGIDYTHPDLAANYAGGYDFYSKDADPMDEYGHGTHVAGTIAAVGNNGVGVVGVNWRVRLLAVKVFGASGSTQASIIAPGIVWAADQGAKVSNNSYGGPGASQVMADAIRYAYSKGHTFICAAGNNNLNILGYHPAGDRYTLSVAASDSSDAKALFSNWGCVDLCAPGVGITSTKLGGGYIAYNGTSMATPHTCGVAALLLSVHPDWTPEQIRQALRLGADDVQETGWDIYSGFGRANAYKTLLVAEPCECRITGLELQSSGEDYAVKAIVRGANLSGWTLEQNISNSGWTPVSSGSGVVNDAHIGIVHVPFGEGVLIRLTAADSGGQAYTDYAETIQPGWLDGRVTDVETGEPIAGAEIVLNRENAAGGSKVWATDADGRYRIPCDPDYYYLQFKATGYHNSLSLVYCRVESGQSVTADYRLTKTTDLGTMSGRVVSGLNGQALSGVAVTPMTGWGSSYMGTAYTSAAGAFGFTGIPDDNVWLYVQKPGYDSRMLAVRGQAQGAIYPQIAMLSANDTGCMGGIIRDAQTNSRIRDALISLYCPYGLVMSNAVPGPLGSYTVCAAPGTWQVVVTSPGYENATDTATLYGGMVDMWYNYWLTPGSSPPPPPPPPPADTEAPTVALTAPGDGTTVSRKTLLSLMASASDNVGVSRVEWRVNGDVVATDETEPYFAQWRTPAAPGKTYTVRAVAYDAAGNTGYSGYARVYTVK